MKGYFKVNWKRGLSFLLAVSMVLSCGIFSGKNAKADITGYWFFAGNGGELCFSPSAGYDCPHTNGWSLSQDMVNWEKKISFPVTVKRDGYTFEGWNSKADGSGFSLPNTNAGWTQPVSGSSVYLYAQWKPIAYNVNWNANGGSVPQSTTSVLCGEKISSGGVPTPTRESMVSDGYTYYYSFAGWYTMATGGILLNSNMVQKYGGTTFYAHWNLSSVPLNYTLYFDGNNGSATESRRTISRGSMYGSLPSASRSATVNDGYTTTYEFAGWYTSPTGGTQVTANSVMQAADTTVYAHWNERTIGNEYSLSFVGNGGTVSETSRKVRRGQAYGALPTASRDSVVSDGYTSTYKFTGWYTEAAGGNAVTASTVMGAGDKTVYAHWDTITSANQYTLTFDGNGGDSSIGAKTVGRGQAYGELPSASRQPVIKNGYKTTYFFKGWYTAASGGLAVNAQTVMEAGNQTVYAQWEDSTLPITYKLSFNANSGEGDMQSQSVTYGETTVINKNLFYKTGYEFAGWSYTENGSKVFVDEDNVLNLTETENKEILLYALWEIKSFDVTCYDVVYDNSVETEDKKSEGMASDSKLKVLGEHSWTENYNEVVDAGEKLGKDSMIGAYYQGMKYILCTSGVVTEDGCTLYRYFEDFSSSKLDGVTMGNGNGGDGADDGEDDNGNKDKHFVIQNGKNVEELNITRELDVKEIAAGAFGGSSDTLKNLHFDNGTVEIIGCGAFSNCKLLQEVELPYSVNKIEDNAFSGCVNLKEVIIRNPNCEIGEGVFPDDTVIHGFEGSTAIEYAKKNKLPYEIITEIGEGYFEYESSMKDFIIPVGVKEVSKDAFANCPNLEAVVVSDRKLNKIEEGAFKNCVKLKGIFNEKENTDNLYGDLEYVGENAFENTALESFYAKNPNCIIKDDGKKGKTFPVDTILIGWNKSTIHDYSNLYGNKFKKTGNSYQIVFNKNMGTGGTESIYVYNEMELPDIIIPTRDKYIFKGYMYNGILLYNEEGKAQLPVDNMHITGDMAGENSPVAHWEEAEKSPSENVGDTPKPTTSEPDKGEGIGSGTGSGSTTGTTGGEQSGTGSGSATGTTAGGEQSGTGSGSATGTTTGGEQSGTGSGSATGTTAGGEQSGTGSGSTTGTTTGGEQSGTGSGSATGTTAGGEQSGTGSGSAAGTTTGGTQSGTGSIKPSAKPSDTPSGTGDAKPSAKPSTKPSNTPLGTGNAKPSAKPSDTTSGKEDGTLAGGANNEILSGQTGTVKRNKKPAKKPVKGNTYTVGKLKYKVTKIVKKSKKVSFGCVAVVGVKNKKYRKIQIPKAVNIFGIKMKVTAIASKAFYKNKFIKEVIIGGNVEKIGQSAFKNCSNVKNIYIKSKRLVSIGRCAFDGCKELRKVIITSLKLKKVGKYVFRGVHQNAILKAPLKKVGKYQKMFKA